MLHRHDPKNRLHPLVIRACRSYLFVLPLALIACETLLSPAQYAEVRVEVSTASGAPVAGVPVNLYTGQRPIEYAITDARGIYAFKRVPPGNYGVTITVPEGLGDVGESPFLTQDNLDVTRGALRSVTFTLAPCHGSIMVTVRDLTGPAADVPLSLYTGTGVRDTARTGVDGTHQFAGVACGTYGVRIEENSAYTVTPGAGSSYVEQLRVTPATPTLALTLQVRRCRATIRARAVDAAGVGVSGATVTVYTSVGDLVAGLTGGDGTIVFSSTPCGRELGVRVTPPPGYSVPNGRGSSQFDGIRLDDGASTDVTFRLNRP